ncbi:hypothetical protein [Rhabdothermincola sp.]|uniref:hypothetical protein n=1 Tax=Rhabdothermincola sp. TaxID=2820405 RepID=UPI002FE1A659
MRPGRWLGPWWFERQTDPESPEFIPGGGRENLTHRTWTRLGTLTGPERAAIDPRGLVGGPSARWSIDWWIGAEDRWHLPSREVAVRQRLVGHAPVVETAMRVPGGDALHRAFAIAGRDGPEVVIEIENATPVPFAVALALRPDTPAGPGGITTIELDGTVVRADGELALVLPRPPAGVAVGTASGGDAVHDVIAGAATASWPEPVRCERGRANAAFVYPLPHTATLRAVLPLRSPVPSSRRRRPSGPVRVVSSAPTAEQVRKGWDQQVARALRIQLPDDRLSGVIEAARRHLLGLHAGEDVATWPPRPAGWRETAAVVVALDQYGFHEEASQLVAALPDRQGLDGFAGASEEGWAANGAALHAVGEHWRLTRDELTIEELVGPVAKAGHWIGKRWAAGRVRGRGRRGSLPEPGLEDLGWCARGLRDAAGAMAGVGQPELAEDLDRFAEQIVGFLAGGEPDAAHLRAASLGALPEPGERVAAVVALARERWEVGPALVDPAGRGLDPSLTLALATIELRLGDSRALDRLSWLLDHASATVTWPTAVHPRTRGGSAGDGHDGVVTAQACSFFRRLLVDEDRSGLRLCSLYPPGWLGQGVEVHDAPTAFGRLGFAVRWHGERPALLWELDPHPGIGEITLVAPGLDPSWSSNEPRGEALLAPVTPATVTAEPVGSPAPEPGGETGSSSFS